MFNKLLFMSNSFFGRFKKRDNKVVEEHLPIREDRIFWVETLQKIAFPVLNNLKKGSLKKNMSLEASNSESNKIAHLEAFANVFNGIAPWLELGPDESEEGRLREKYILLTLKAIGNAVDSNNNDYIIFNVRVGWSTIDQYDQISNDGHDSYEVKLLKINDDYRVVEYSID